MSRGQGKPPKGFKQEGPGHICGRKCFGYKGMNYREETEQAVVIQAKGEEVWTHGWLLLG